MGLPDVLARGHAEPGLDLAGLRGGTVFPGGVLRTFRSVLLRAVRYARPLLRVLPELRPGERPGRRPGSYNRRPAFGRDRDLLVDLALPVRSGPRELRLHTPALGDLPHRPHRRSARGAPARRGPLEGYSSRRPAPGPRAP